MARETWVQSQVESYQRLKKWYLMPPCLTLSIIWYGSRVKWSNLGKGVAPSPTPRCSSYRKGNLRVILDHGRLYKYINIYIYIYIYIYIFLRHRNLSTGFLSVCLRCSSSHHLKTLSHAKSLRWPNKGKPEGSRSGQ